MKFVSLLLALLLLATSVARARFIATLPFEELRKQADLVVVALPLDSHDTAERSTFEGLSRGSPCVGVNTTFRVALVLKGRRALHGRGRFTLRHFRAPDPETTANGLPARLFLDGPNLLDLAGGQAAAKSHYLLFLRREPDGRFSPLLGQVDPAAASIFRLAGSER